MKKFVPFSSVCIALSIVALGWFIKSGLDSFSNRDRKVVVKGLAEKEVDADKVIWPIVSKELGNELPALYTRIGSTQSKIRAFLLREGIPESALSIGAPQVADLNAREYGDRNQPYRYIITSVITVTSSDVDLVRSVIARQGDLLKEGVAIVDGGYENPVRYEFVSLNDMKPEMMQEAIGNAEKTALQFAQNSHSKLDKIVSATQGQFSIEDRDYNTPWKKNVRVVTTITYSLKD